MQHPLAVALHLGQFGRVGTQLRIEFGHPAVLDLGGLGGVVAALRLFELGLVILDLTLQLARLVDLRFFRLELRGEPRAFFLAVGEFLFELAEAFAARGVLFFF